MADYLDQARPKFLSFIAFSKEDWRRLWSHTRRTLPQLGTASSIDPGRGSQPRTGSRCEVLVRWLERVP